MPLIKSTVLLLLCIGNITPEEITDQCVGCIRQAVSGSNQLPKCETESDVCGLFHVTKYYWIDAGQFTIYGQSPIENDAFPNCVNDPICAVQTVKSYMKKLAKDCNSDGVINCNDYMAMHKNGGYHCSGSLPEDYVSNVTQCLATVATAAPSTGRVGHILPTYPFILLLTYITL